MNHSAALAAASASAADCTKSPRSVAAQQNQRYTLKGPKTVHDAGSASTGFFTTALRPKLPAQTPRARRRPPTGLKHPKFLPLPPSRMASTAHDPPEPRHDRFVMQSPTAALSAAAGDTGTRRRKPQPAAALSELRVELVRSTAAFVCRRVDRCGRAVWRWGEHQPTSETRGGAGGRVLSHE